MYEYIQRNYRLCHIAHGTITMKNYLQLYGISYLDKPFYSGAGCRKHARAGVNLTENREGYLDALGIYYRIIRGFGCLSVPFLGLQMFTENLDFVASSRGGSLRFRPRHP